MADTDWTLDDLALLRMRFGSWPNAKLSLYLDRDIAEVQAKAEELMLAKNKAVFAGRSMPRWAPAELDILRDLYHEKTNEEIARILKRSLKSVSSKASKLGLKKEREQLSTMGRNNRALRRPRT
tara:strand:- start:42 stop:413 length:372 start_codon:yes stop_codon:yes gene_type:complete